VVGRAGLALDDPDPRAGRVRADELELVTIAGNSGEDFCELARVGRFRLDEARVNLPQRASVNLTEAPLRSVTCMSLIRSRTSRSSNWDSFSTYCSLLPIFTR
jgi:hypothetical protein